MSRIDKIQEELRQQVSMIVQQELRDPRIGFVTITEVELTADLKEAKIYFTIMDTGRSTEGTVRALKNSAAYVRRLIGQRIKIKFTPEIKFVYDDSQIRQSRIDEIIDKIHKESKDEAE